MNTTNIISTPDITGNIGSCSTKVEMVSDGRTLWKQTKTSIATNSCTGQVTTYSTWEFTGFFGFSMVLPIVILFTIIFAIAAGTDSHY